MLKKILNKKYYFYSLLLAFIVLLFTSKNSFLYTFNDWVDANAFFTVGKSMMRGVVPYKDLFEQKGIFLYFIYGIGYLFSNTSFYGVFILEVISFSIFLYFTHKLFSLYFKEKFSLIVLPIIAYLITTSLAFVHGGSCEEFALSFMMISIYYYFKHFKVSKLTNKETILNGIMCSLVFLMKYTMIGLWIGFGLFIFIDYLRKKDYKSSFKFCMYFLIGFLIPILITLLYLGINHAIKDFIECYFTINMTSYSDNKTNIITNLIKLPRGVVKALTLNGNILLILTFLIPVSIFSMNIKDEDTSIKSDKYFKLGILSLVLFTVLTIYWGLKYFTYYLLPVIMFVSITLLGIALYFKKCINKLLGKKYLYIIIILINILFLGLAYNNANYKNCRNWTKKDFFQFKYAKYINKYKNPTLLNMGFLDGGLYTTTGIVPNTRFFEEQNISYDRFPDNLDGLRNSACKKKAKFILFYSQVDLDWVKANYSCIFKNYELVFDDTHYFENAVKMNAYLFKLKGLKK